MRYYSAQRVDTADSLVRQGQTLCLSMTGVARREALRDEVLAGNRKLRV